MQIPTTDIYVPTEAGRLFARIWGDRTAWPARPPILLLHDSLGSVELWRDFPAALAAATGHDVIAYDRLGFGKSDASNDTFDIVTLIHNEARVSMPALRETLGIDRMILFGHSVGGAMAIVSAAEFPEATVALITESAQVFPETLTLDSIREAKVGFEAPGQLARLARYHGDKAEWVLKAWTDRWLDPDFATWTVDDSLRRVRCPILAMHGDHDEYGSHAHPTRIAALAPGPTRIAIFDDCGHVPHREKPAAVLHTVVDFRFSFA